MLRGGAPLCNISFWCNGVIDYDYLSRCHVYSTGDDTCSNSVGLHFWVPPSLDCALPSSDCVYVEWFSFDDLMVTYALV
jgi:hypothetical protein